MLQLFRAKPGNLASCFIIWFCNDTVPWFMYSITAWIALPPELKTLTYYLFPYIWLKNNRLNSSVCQFLCNTFISLFEVVYIGAVKIIIIDILGE